MTVSTVGTTKRALPVLVLGLIGSTLLTAAFVPFRHVVDVTIPTLALLVPVALASARGGWWVAVILAVFSAAAIALCFIPPVGAIRVGLTRDLATLVTFLAVGIVVARLAAHNTHDSVPIDDRRVQLLRAVSHNLRSPLHTIQAVTSDLLRAEQRDATTRSSMLSLVADESDRLDKMIANMLSAGRIQAGDMQPSMLPEYLPSLVEATTSRVARSAAASERRMVVDVEATMVAADAVQFDQVLTNLLDNALRFTPVGRSVWITGRRVDRDVEIVVDDEGPGFAPGIVGRQPEPYRRDRSSPGVGLGLAVCKGIVDAHGGSLRLGTSRHGGASVTVRMLCADRLLTEVGPPPE